MGNRRGLGRKEGVNRGKYKQNHILYVMELPLTELLLLVASVFGMVSIIVYTRGRFGNNEINTKLKNRYNEYIAELEFENKKLKGAISRAKAPVRIYAESADEPLSAISEVIDGLIPNLPPAVRPLLKSKKAVDFITNYVQSNPEAVKDLIAKFTKTKTAESGQSNQATQQQSL